MTGTPTPKPAASKQLKRAHARSGKHVSLRQFILTSDDETIQKLGADWLYNKRTNFSKAPLGIGSTRKKKIRQQQKK